MIREKTDPCASVKLPHFGRWGFAESRVFDKSTPNGICVAPCDLWETPIIPHGHSPFCIRRKYGFLRSPLSFLSHRSRRFPQMQIHTACEKSVSICRTSSAICGLTNHLAWHLRSVGDPNHPAWPFFTQHSKDPFRIIKLLAFLQKLTRPI